MLIMLLHQQISSLIIFISLFLSSTNSIRLLMPNEEKQVFQVSQFSEAPQYENGPECPVLMDQIHIAMTLDLEYLRGSMAAIHSVLKHTCCPENIFFHFIASSNQETLTNTIQSTFPSLKFNVCLFNEDLVRNIISSSIRKALDNPLNYARSYLANILDHSVRRVIYLDSDIIVVDDIQSLWKIPLSGSRTIGAPEYCHANFTNYFTDDFWSDPEFSKVFDDKNPCYFNTGVMVMDLEKWREGDYTTKIEKWMEVQRERRIYELGSLPPFLLVFGGDVEAIDHKWNQHGLGGDNVMGKCRSLHPGPISLLHWSGKGKPWLRLDSGAPCLVDYLWAPYDLYKHHTHHQEYKKL